MLRSPVCTSAGCASKREGKNPPRCLSSSVPSSRIAGDHEADLIEVRHEHHERLALADTHDEVAGACRCWRAPSAGSMRLTASRTGALGMPDTP